MISIIIPTFNTALLIERSIRSVLNQKNISDFELIIVDDCSTDDTLDVVHSINDPRIRIFRQRENRGPAAARNRGLAEAKGVDELYLWVQPIDGNHYLAAYQDGNKTVFAYCELAEGKTIGKVLSKGHCQVIGLKGVEGNIDLVKGRGGQKHFPLPGQKGAVGG